MADIQSYERVLKKKRLKSVILAVSLYALILFVWLIVIFGVGRFDPALILLAPISTLAVVLITWKYTRVEYEYSFVGGTFTFSKIYGGRSRRCVLEVEIRSLKEIFPYNEETAKKIENITDKTLIKGIPSGSSQNPCVLSFEDNKEKAVFFILDCDGRSAKILKFYNPSAVHRAILEKISDQK